jgi:hypothetical protein
MLTNKIGCYVLCDLDEVPIYVGQSVDGIRARVRRHLTSARSDIIANRQIDVWEIAYVWAYPVEKWRRHRPNRGRALSRVPFKIGSHEWQGAQAACDQNRGARAISKGPSHGRWRNPGEKGPRVASSAPG